MTKLLSHLAIEDLEKDGGCAYIMDLDHADTRQTLAVMPRDARPGLIVRTIILFATSSVGARLKPIDCAKSKPSQVLSAAVARDSVRSLLDSS